MEESIKKDIEKDIEEGIKEIVKQIIEEIVEEINIKKDIENLFKLRSNNKNKKRIRKFLAYYRNLREMKDKRSEYKKGYKI
jgi:hypothetical protein